MTVVSTVTAPYNSKVSVCYLQSCSITCVTHVSVHWLFACRMCNVRPASLRSYPGPDSEVVGGLTAVCRRRPQRSAGTEYLVGGSPTPESWTLFVIDSQFCLQSCTWTLWICGKVSWHATLTDAGGKCSPSFTHPLLPPSIRPWSSRRLPSTSHALPPPFHNTRTVLCCIV